MVNPISRTNNIQHNMDIYNWRMRQLATQEKDPIKMAGKNLPVPVLRQIIAAKNEGLTKRDDFSSGSRQILRFISQAVERAGELAAEAMAMPTKEGVILKLSESNKHMMLAKKWIPKFFERNKINSHDILNVIEEHEQKVKSAMPPVMDGDLDKDAYLNQSQRPDHQHLPDCARISFGTACNCGATNEEEDGHYSEGGVWIPSTGTTVGMGYDPVSMSFTLEDGLTKPGHPQLPRPEESHQVIVEDAESVSLKL